MKILAKLIQLLPLHLDSLKTEFSKELQAKVDQGIEFLKVFAENQIVEDYPIVIPINAELRQY
jgi:TATA-binding protein-associated factor